MRSQNFASRRRLVRRLIVTTAENIVNAFLQINFLLWLHDSARVVSLFQLSSILLFASVLNRHGHEPEKSDFSTSCPFPFRLLHQRALQKSLSAETNVLICHINSEHPVQLISLVKSTQDEDSSDDEIAHSLFANSHFPNIINFLETLSDTNPKKERQESCVSVHHRSRFWNDLEKANTYREKFITRGRRRATIWWWCFYLDTIIHVSSRRMKKRTNRCDGMLWLVGVHDSNVHVLVFTSFSHPQHDWRGIISKFFPLSTQESQMCTARDHRVLALTCVCGPEINTRLESHTQGTFEASKFTPYGPDKYWAEIENKNHRKPVSVFVRA